MTALPKGFVNRLVYAAFSLLVTAGIFGYLFTHVTPSQVIALFREMDLRGLYMFFVLSFAMSFFRTWRYRVALRPAGFAPAKISLFLVVLVRNFFADLLPARLGTVIYVYLVNSRLGVPFGAAASSFALAFLFDMIALAPLIAVAALLAGAGSGFSPVAMAVGGAVLCGITVAALVMLPPLTAYAAKLTRTMHWLGVARSERWASALEETRTDLVKAKQAGVYGELLVLSILVRLAKYGALYVFMYALVAPYGYLLGDLSVPKVFLGVCASEMAASLPISGIAGFGAYEGTWAFVFRLLGFSGEVADITAISHHLFTQLYGYILGALALLLLLLPVFRAKQPPVLRKQTASAPFLLRVLLATVACALAVWGIYRIGTAIHHDGPVYPARAWATKSPEQLGYDSAKLALFTNMVGGNGCVIRSGYMIYSWGNITTRIDVASAVKPFYTHLLVRSVEEGVLDSLDEPVARYMPGLTNLNPELGYPDREITWRHLCRHVSGYGNVERPGEAYNYSDHALALLINTLIHKVHGVSYNRADTRVLRPYLTEPLQCQDRPTLAGRRSRPGRLRVSVRDFARFGLLYARGANWKGRQIISPEHYRMIVSSPLGPDTPRTSGEPADMRRHQRTIGGYESLGEHLNSNSYLWWVNGVMDDGNRLYPSAPDDTFGAVGFTGKIFLGVIPSEDLVVCWIWGITGTPYASFAEGGYRVVDMALKTLLDARIDPAP